MKPKPFYTSLTFWSLVATLFGLVLAGLGSGEPLWSIIADQEVQGTIGDILVIVGAVGVFGGRVRAKGPLTLTGAAARERGMSNVGALLLVPLLMLFAAGVAGVVLTGLATFGLLCLPLIGGVVVAKARSSQGGRGALTALVVLLCSSMAAGCLARHVEADNHVGLEIDRGPPCQITTSADGEVVQTITGPNRCKVKVDGIPVVDEPATGPVGRNDVQEDTMENRNGEPHPKRHPAVAGLLKYFAWAHLPPKLQEVSRPFGELAERVADLPSGPEVTVSLRKLLEAKDCAVRAALG